MPFQVVSVPLAPCAARSARDPADPVQVPAGQRLGRSVWGVGSVCEGVERFEALPKVPQEWGKASGVERDRKNLSQGLAGPVCPVRVGCLLCAHLSCALTHFTPSVCLSLWDPRADPVCSCPQNLLLRQAKLGLCRS